MGTEKPAQYGSIARLGSAPPTVIVILCAWGLFTSWAVTCVHPQRMWSGVQDFTALYAGGLLAGTGQLYSNAALHEWERQLVGNADAAFHYVRLPIVAAAYKPLTWIPYAQALVVWKFLTCLGFVALAWLLPVPRRLTCVAAAVSLGAVDAVLMGQDVWLSVLAIAAFLSAARQGRDTRAGIFLGLALIMRYHIFPFAVLALMVHRKWRLLATSAAVGAMGFLSSFAIEGPAWPLECARVLIAKGAVSPFNMTNLGGLVAVFRLGIGAYLLLYAMAAVTVARIAHQSSMPFALGIAIFAGVLAAPHGYVHDFTIFIPALLPLAVEYPWFERHCAYWLMPFPLAPLVASVGVLLHIGLLLGFTATLYAAACFPLRERRAGVRHEWTAPAGTAAEA